MRYAQEMALKRKEMDEAAIEQEIKDMARLVASAHYRKMGLSGEALRARARDGAGQFMHVCAIIYGVLPALGWSKRK